LDFSYPTYRLNILVLGYIVRGPFAGMTWHHLQYVKGLELLNHRVFYMEDSGDSEYCCYHPISGVTDSDPTYGLTYLKQSLEYLKLNTPWAYYDKHQNQWHSHTGEKPFMDTANFDLLINLSCSNMLRDWYLSIPIRVLIDTDPLFTQIRNLQSAERWNLSQRHNRWFTFGENIPTGDSKVPDDGFPWKATRQPIVLTDWNHPPRQGNGKFTSIIQWESYPTIEYNGISYGMKSSSFLPFFDFPTKIDARMELALGSPSAPRSELRRAGWEIVNPVPISESLHPYKAYIQQSYAEFCICKEGYVISQTGWFSERSAAYLASGRPVLAQDTGFTNHLETGTGLLAFQDPKTALEAVDYVTQQYAMHSRRARELAAAYFDSYGVLNQLIESCI